MEDFFKANSPAMRFLTAVFNLIAVNIMFLISSLPVITAGAALTGLIKIVYEILEGEEVFLIRDFTKAYISNFKRATLFWVPYVLLWAFLGYDVFLVWNKLEGTSFWMMIPPILILLIISCIAVYAFPLITIFKDTFKNTIKNALLLAIGNMPTTVMVLVIHSLVIGVLLRVDSFSVILGSLLLFIGVSLIALVDSIFVRRTLKRSGFISIDPVKVAEQEATQEEQEEE